MQSLSEIEANRESTNMSLLNQKIHSELSMAYPNGSLLTSGFNTNLRQRSCQQLVSTWMDRKESLSQRISKDFRPLARNDA